MNLQKRLTGLFINPKREWTTIAGEATDIAAIYKKYILIVAAVPAVSLLLRLTVSGVPFVGLRTAIASYLAAIVAPIVAALVVEQLAPKFHSHGNTVQTLKLVAYSSAPLWLAGVFVLIPGLSWIATIAGLAYGLYLFYLGAGPLLGTPQEEAVPFVVVCALSLLVINIVLSFVFSRFDAYYYL
jgi:Yip1-like protein